MHLTIIQNKRQTNQRVTTIQAGQSDFFFGNRFEVEVSPTEPDTYEARVRFVPDCRLPEKFTLRDLMPVKINAADYIDWTPLTNAVTVFAISDTTDPDETIEIIVDSSPFE